MDSEKKYTNQLKVQNWIKFEMKRKFWKWLVVHYVLGYRDISMR